MTDKFVSILTNPPSVSSAVEPTHKIWVATARYSALIGVTFGDEYRGWIIVGLDGLEQMIDLLTNAQDAICSNIADDKAGAYWDDKLGWVVPTS